MFIPFYNFHALKFNPNTVLLPTWAGTTFWFLRSYKTRGVIYSALAGIGAGACMLGKYWSVFLLAPARVTAPRPKAQECHGRGGPRLHHRSSRALRSKD
jgi:hypothetical protein